LGACLPSAERYQPATQIPSSLVSIALTPANPSISTSQTQQFIATGTYSDNSTQTLASVIWSSSNTGVAAITNDAGNHGVAVPSGNGTTTISASAGSISGSTTLTVTALVSIAVTPANASTAGGLPQQFTATGTYSDTSTRNLTSAVNWSS